MSYHVFFDFSLGLARPISAPKGMKESLNQHVREVEEKLNIRRSKYKDNPAYWDLVRNDFGHVTDEELCEIAGEHNRWVRGVYRDFTKWQRVPPDDAEQITPEEAQEFWPGLRIIQVPPERWTGEYYTERMECLYEVMRGRETEGISFDAPALAEKQAASVINLFSEFLDREDRRLDVPNGHDHLASSYDGGYHWCEECGAMTLDDVTGCQVRKCPLRAELEIDEEPNQLPVAPSVIDPRNP